jgi:hypothetical protein
MTDRWASHDEIGSGDIFETVHSGLTVRLIATSRDDLMTCKADEAASDVIDRNTQQYDFIPVVAGGGTEDQRIVGLFHVAPFRGGSSPKGSIADHLLPLAENYLVGADASILDFIKDADTKPCRMVICGARISGLVSLSDLQRLPVRAALFALVTGFEITMSEAIRQKFNSDEDWIRCLTDGRQEKIKREIAESHRDDSFVDALLFTQFCDKADIIAKSFQLAQSKTKLRDQLAEIQKLRDSLAHANEYAASPAEAKRTCQVVRSLLALKEEITA